MSTLRRITGVIAAILILVSASGGSVKAAEAAEEAPEPIQTEAGSLLVEAESTDNFRYEDGRLYVYGGTVSVKTSPAVDYSTDRIEVSGYACLVLNGVRIKAEEGAAVSVLPGADAQIRLAVYEKDEESQDEENEEYERIIENYLEGSEGYAGIEAGTLPGGENEHSLAANLRISGNGYLTAAGGEGAAGIGGSRGQNACGIITIEEGNIKAVAGEGADAIGCGAQSCANPAYAPLVSENVSSLLALADGTGRAIAPAASEEAASEEVNTEEGGAEEYITEDAQDGDPVPEDFAPAALLRASFTESGDGTLAGLENVRVRDLADSSETDFNMPEGYREFALKVEADSEYMIEQGGRIFAASDTEDFSGEIEENDETAVIFKGTSQSGAKTVYLAPVLKAPAVDIDVTGCWEDEDNKDGLRPESIMVTLYANGKETGRTITLSEENDWCGTFDDLAVYQDSVRQCYCVVEESVEGYTGMISGSDRDGYTITNRHEPLPEGRSAEEEIEYRNSRPFEEGRVVATVLTTKVSRSMPARTSTTIRKTQSAKTADHSPTIFWGGVLLLAVISLFIWMRFEQSKE